MTSARLSLQQALAGAASANKDKPPSGDDGTLTVTPDPPEWGTSVLDQLCESAEEETGPSCKKPNQLFGKFTWKIESFSKISKREMRSVVFDVGEYKWYILVYPQGCDVCNHLSLFLCVADYDKLLPGWSHFAQFTIAVVNKDPKKSKYSDTLHRFCKKEHDWGWKKFMELNKVLDGFTVADTLVIKAQVQVILDRPSRPFRCLDAQYRRELVRVYLTNVESICRRFCDERRTRLGWLRSEGPAFRAWWRGLGQHRQAQLTQAKGDPILKGLVKQFFNEKEVTSTLVMDALFCGCKQLEKLSRSKEPLLEGSAAPCVVINGSSCTFSFALDALEVITQISQDFIPSTKADKLVALGGDDLLLRSGCDELSELRRDALERDERRLAELGRRTVEMYALAHIFTEVLERAYRDHQAELRMHDLIAEEEAAGRLEDQRAAARAAADKEKRAKKKERKKAKKEAERAKRDAEAVEQPKQQEQQQQQQQQPQQQQQQQQEQKQQHMQPGEAAAAGSSITQQPVSNGNQHNSSIDKLAVHRLQQQRPSTMGKAKQQAVAAAAMRGGQHSSVSSPAVGSAAESESSSCDDSSDSGSSSNGFAPIQQLHQQPQHQVVGGRLVASQHGAGGYGAMHNLHHIHSGANSSSNSNGAAAPGGNHSTGSGCMPSIPTGYAAAVAGMKPPPPAEVTAAALALAEQQRQVRDLEDQVASLKQQVVALEAAVSHRDALLLHREQEAGELRLQLAQQAQQIQDICKQEAEWRAAAAAAIGSSSQSSGTAEMKSFAAVAARLAGASSRGSSRSRGTSIDLTNGAAAAPAGAGAALLSPAPWATAGGAAVPSRAAAVGSVTAASKASDGGTTGGPGPQDLGQQHQAAAAAATGSLGPEQANSNSSSSSSSVADSHAPSGLARGAPLTYAESVAGQVPQHHQHGQQQQQAAGSYNVTAVPHNSNIGAAAAVGPNPGTAAASSSSSRQSSCQQQLDEQPPSSSGTPLAAQPGCQPFSSSSSSGGLVEGPGTISSGCNGPVVLQDDAAATTSNMDEPVSPRELARSISGGAAAPGSSTASLDGRATDASSTASSSSQAALGAAFSRDSSNSAGAGGRSTSGRGGSSVNSSSMPDGLSGLSLKASAAVGPGSYLSNGIAGVLHSSTPLQQDSAQRAPSFHSAAAGGSGIGAAAAGAGPGSDAGPAGMLSAPSAAPGPPRSSSGDKGKVPAAPQQHPFGGFGSQIASGARGMFGPMPAAKGAADGRASQSSILEDAGLDGFVHMNMIDDLLTE